MKFYNIIGICINFYNTILKFRSCKNPVKDFLYLFKIYISTKKNLKKKYKKNRLNINQLKKFKKTKTVFIFGSGYSLKKIKKSKWKKLSKFDSIGFNNTILLKKINFTYHVNREIKNSKKNIKKQVNLINRNKQLNKTVFLMPEGIANEYTNNIFSKNIWDKSKKFFLFKTNRITHIPFGDLNIGLIHKSGTLMDCISLAYYLEYKRIVLVGVDLYDRRYFYVPKNKTSVSLGIPADKDIHNKQVDYIHQTMINKLEYYIKKIDKFFKKKNISLEVYNNKSLLKKNLKLFKF
jgi:hypothetical protein